MIRFFVLDEAGDHELAFELDDYGEESYHIPDENSSVADSNIKKFIKIKTFKHLKEVTDKKYYTCKIPTYPEVFVASINQINPFTGAITFKSYEDFVITSEFVIFKERKYLFVQPLKYAPVFEDEEQVFVCFTVLKDNFDDEKCEISELPHFSFTTNDIKDPSIGNAGSWRMVFNSEYIENENRHLSEEIVKKYKIRKYQDLKNQKEFYISRPLKNLKEVLLKEPCFNGIVLTLLDVVKDAPFVPYSFDSPYSGWYFTVFPFISFVHGLSYCEATSISGRLFHLCQSSGHGKTRLCFELLKFMKRGAYCVYRSGINENGFPKTTPWMKNLIKAFDMSKCDLDSMLICSQFLVAALKSFNSPSADRMKIFDGESTAEAKNITSNYFQLNYLLDLSEIEKTKSLNSNLVRIKKLCNRKTFPIIFDECHEMLRVPSNNPESINLYRAMRRVLFKIRHTKVVAVFLGTKSSLSDFVLNSRRDQSLREAVGDEEHKFEIPLYVYTQSVDAMFNKPYCISYEGCYRIKNIGGSHIIVPLDLRDISRNFGRPLWARYSFQQAIELALEKLKTDLNIFELTCLIMRIGSKVVAQDELAHKLVLSGMATLINVDIYGSRCLVEYIPEPILSNAARIALTNVGKYKKAIKEYVRRLQLGTFHDSGSAGEIVGRIVLLRAMDLSILKRKKNNIGESKEVEAEAFRVGAIFDGAPENQILKALKFAEWSEKISKLRGESTEAFYVSPKLLTETIELSAETDSKDLESSCDYIVQNAEIEIVAEPSSTTTNFTPTTPTEEETISVDVDTSFISPLIGASTVKEFLMFLSDLTDASSLNNLGVSEEVLDGLVCFNQFVQMDHPLKVNQQILLHFFARSSALILADGAAGADLKIPVLRTDNKMSCISIQIKNYSVSTFPHKSSETTSKFMTEHMKYLNLGPIADFEEVHKDDFVRIVIQFNEKGFDQVVMSENLKNIHWVNIPNSISQASSAVNQVSRRKVQCQALWIRGLECFRPLFFDDESLIKDLNIILSGQRDFLNAVEFPKITLPTLLQTTEIGARVLADCARPLATFNNVIKQDTKFHGTIEYSEYKSKLVALSIPSFADEFMNNRTLTTDKNLVTNDIVESHSEFDSAPMEWKEEMDKILIHIREINIYRTAGSFKITNIKNKNAKSRRIREISDDDDDNDNMDMSKRQNTYRGG